MRTLKRPKSSLVPPLPGLVDDVDVDDARAPASSHAIDRLAAELASAQEVKQLEALAEDEAVGEDTLREIQVLQQGTEADMPLDVDAERIVQAEDQTLHIHLRSKKKTKRL